MLELHHWIELILVIVILLHWSSVACVSLEHGHGWNRGKMRAGSASLQFFEGAEWEETL